MSKKSWIDSLTTGGKRDGSGSWWSSSIQSGRQATRRSENGDVTHYRHAGGKVEGWKRDGKTGQYSKFSKRAK